MKDDEIRDALFDAAEWRPGNVDADLLRTFKAVDAEEARTAGLDERMVVAWIGRHGGRMHRVEGVTLGGVEGGDEDAALTIPAVDGFLIPRSALEL